MNGTEYDLIQQRGDLRAAIAAALKELGVPDEHYPAPVGNAVSILSQALQPHD